MKFALMRNDKAFMVMEAESVHATPTKIEKAGDSMYSPVGYAERLAKSRFNASVEAIASRLGRDVTIETMDGEEPSLTDMVDKARRTDAPVVVEEDAPIDLMASGEIAKTDKAQQIVFGWAYVTHDTEGQVNIDKSGDFIDTVEEIEKSAYDFVLNSRSSDADHTNVKGGTLVESIVFTPEKIEKMGLPVGSVPYGWWLGFKIEDDATWARVEKGELRAFSIHGSGTRTKVDPTL